MTRRHAAVLLLLAATACGPARGDEDPQPPPGDPAMPDDAHEQTTPETEDATHAENRLAQESSPYLLQHRHNPVDWYPWGEEAFQKARGEQKPVFLSIGYSTCHWCHVMERESFENDDIAAVLNEHFVAVKVDREERPDVDAVYMSAVQALTGRGGWPLSVWMTADGKPFFGGTYFPPEDRFGRAGFQSVLLRIAELWRTDRTNLIAQSDKLLEHVRSTNSAAGGVELDAEVLALAVRQFESAFDAERGGFGPAPKFPRAFSHWFLLRQAANGRQHQVLPMVQRSLDAMRLGGIHDHVGGGFHRYSTDADWLVPHFEKMLYDQAVLARAYAEGHQVLGIDRYADTARDILEYVLRDLRDDAGGFHSAEDADSEGEEGKFYVWTHEELTAVLGAEGGALIADVYQTTDRGNFVDEATGVRNGNNILHLEKSIAEVAAARQTDPVALAAELAALREKLLEARGERVRPGLDDKVLTDWNGLMIGAFAYCGRTLGEPRYIAAAQEAAEFVVDEMWDGERLLHRYRRGEKGIPGFLEDYAYLAHGLFELHQATQDARWLGIARDLLHRTVDLFHDADSGGFFLAPRGGEELVTRTKELYDGALPSGNSVALHELLRTGRLTGDERLLALGRETLAAWSGTIQRYPMGYPFALLGLDLEVGTAREIVIAGDPSAESTRALLAVTSTRYAPRDLVLVHPTGAAGESVRAIAPFVAAQGPVDGRPAAYVCTDRACQAPVTTPADLLRALDARE